MIEGGRRRINRDHQALFRRLQRLVGQAQAPVALRLWIGDAGASRFPPGQYRGRGICRTAHRSHRQGNSRCAAGRVGGGRDPTGSTRSGLRPASIARQRRGTPRGLDAGGAGRDECGLLPDRISGRPPGRSVRSQATPRRSQWRRGPLCAASFLLSARTASELNVMIVDAGNSRGSPRSHRQCPSARGIAPIVRERALHGALPAHPRRGFEYRALRRGQV